ncbi:hypothetical protein HDU96_006175 [Phlyctochytrium bullatum]|nr:hypothetical protein HDU96_006175 [Phlyctochytrium bullatum]
MLSSPRLSTRAKLRLFRREKPGQHSWNAGEISKRTAEVLEIPASKIVTCKCRIVQEEEGVEEGVKEVVLALEVSDLAKASDELVAIESTIASSSPLAKKKAAAQAKDQEKSPVVNIWLTRALAKSVGLAPWVSTSPAVSDRDDFTLDLLCDLYAVPTTSWPLLQCIKIDFANGSEDSVEHDTFLPEKLVFEELIHTPVRSGQQFLFDTMDGRVAKCVLTIMDTDVEFGLLNKNTRFVSVTPPDLPEFICPTAVFGSAGERFAKTICTN